MYFYGNESIQHKRLKGLKNNSTKGHKDSFSIEREEQPIALHHGHHLLRTMMKFNAQQADENAKKEKFMKEYNLTQ